MSANNVIIIDLDKKTVTHGDAEHKKSVFDQATFETAEEALRIAKKMQDECFWEGMNVEYGIVIEGNI